MHPRLMSRDHSAPQYVWWMECFILCSLGQEYCHSNTTFGKVWRFGCPYTYSFQIPNHVSTYWKVSYDTMLHGLYGVYMYDMHKHHKFVVQTSSSWACILKIISLCRSHVVVILYNYVLIRWQSSPRRIVKKNTRQKKDDSNFARMDHDVAFSLSWSKSICNFEMSIVRIRGFPENYCFSLGERPWTQRQAPRIQWFVEI